MVKQTGRRLVGLDLFRMVAVFGMLVAHVGPAAWIPGVGLGEVQWQWEVFHSRMPAMFAFAAGVSLNLGKNARAERFSVWGVSLIVRAVLLTVCGLALAALGTPVVVILAYFGVYFVLAIPVLYWRARALFVLAAVWAVAGPAASFLLRSVWGGEGSVVWQVLVAGDYPALTWMPFVICGIAVGKLNLNDPTVRRRLGVVGASVAVAAYGASALFMQLGGRGALIHLVEAAGGGGEMRCSSSRGCCTVKPA